MPRRPVLAGAIAAFFLMLALPVLAAQDSPQAEATFTSNSELVLVPVQVLDHAGQPVRGLQAENFTLYSDDKPQKIGLFQEVVSRPTATRSGDLLRVSTSDSEQSSPTFSNVPTNGLPPQSLILAIDLVNTSPYLQQWTKTQVINYLRTKPPNLPTALVAITPDGLRQFQGFTTDFTTMVTAVQRIGPRSGPIDFANAPALHLSFSRPGAYENSMAEIEQVYGRSMVDAWNAIFASLRSFDEMAWAYAGIPGRKTVVWFTSGFPVLETYPDPPPLFGKPGNPLVEPSTSRRHFGKRLLPYFQNTFTALSRANVVLYPVDVTGLPEDRPWDVWNVLFGDPPCSVSFPLYRPPSSFRGGCNINVGWLDRIGIKEMASGTGGKECTAGNHVGHCLDQATVESSDYYLLGFYVRREKRQSGWHELKVNVSVDHGEVRARAGYLLDAAGLQTVERQQEMDHAINAAVEYTGLAFEVSPGAHPSGSNAPIVFKVSMPGSSIFLTPGETKLSFDVVAAPLTDQGTPIHDAARITKIDIPEQKVQIALTKGWRLVDFVDGSNRIAAVKVVVRDNVTGKIGSVVFPVPGGGASL